MRDPRLLTERQIKEIDGVMAQAAGIDVQCMVAAHITAQSELIAAALKEAEETYRELPSFASARSIKRVIAILKGEQK